MSSVTPSGQKIPVAEATRHKASRPPPIQWTRLMRRRWRGAVEMVAVGEDGFIAFVSAGGVALLGIIAGRARDCNGRRLRSGGEEES